MSDNSDDAKLDADGTRLEIQSTLTQVSEQLIDPDSKGVKVVFCVRNEKFRLAYFLDYYRDLGVKEFFAIDNDSTDDTQNFLLSQSDVHVFHTDASYKESNAGRNWTSELADLYCEDNWCLTLDVDEFFVYPDFERIDLNLLTKYLDRWRYQGVFSIFLDFYSKLPLSQVDYKEGESTFSLCDHFDSADSYSSFETQNFPFLQIKGGIRQRIFWSRDDLRSGPSMRKIVLVKWNRKFTYLHSTHSCEPIRLADFAGVIAHFKFMSHMKEFAAAEVARNDRVENSADWKVYAKKLGQDDVVFYDPKHSVRYTGSESLVADGHLRASMKYFDYCYKQLFDSVSDVKKFNSDRMERRKKLMNDVQLRTIPYSQLTQIWSSVSLFSLTYGRGKNIFNSILRIEESVDAVLKSRQWRLTYPLRKVLYKYGFIGHKAMVEDNNDGDIYRNFSRTYGSIWWDLLVVVRLPMKLFRRSRRFLRRKKNQLLP